MSLEEYTVGLADDDSGAYAIKNSHGVEVGRISYFSDARALETILTSHRPLVQAVQRVKHEFHACDNSADKKHPWIPGAAAPEVIAVLDFALQKAGEPVK